MSACSRRARNMLEELTGVPTLAVLPFWPEHGLPEEDGVFDARPTGSGLSVVVVAYPYMSNLDEFAPLRRVPGVSLGWARRPETIAAADLLVLPGSKHVAADLLWLREQGLDAAIAAHIAADKPTLAICGGLQMLGRAIEDPCGVEGAAQGLGLLPFSTEFLPAKRYRNGLYTLEGSDALLGAAERRRVSGLRDSSWGDAVGSGRRAGQRARRARCSRTAPVGSAARCSRSTRTDYSRAPG